ncbi:MAG: prenyltransferase/squalene oxidase repeat-containing protein [Planctomycetota bacterium]
MRYLVTTLAVALAAAGARAQVRHVEPSERSASVGLDLPFEPDLDRALARAGREGRLVLWAPPTVPRSPMDRKQICDLYLRSALFAEPGLRPLLARYVLYRGEPTAAQAKRFDLVPFHLVEPGWVVLDSEGKERDRLHAVGTFCVPWLRRRLAAPLSDADRREAARAGGELEGWLQAMAAGRFEVTAGDGEASPARLWYAAVSSFEPGGRAEATALLPRLAEADAPGSLGARAALELERFGPLGRGFLRYTAPLDGAGLDGRSTSFSVPLDRLPEVRAAALAYLLRMQREDGGYEDSNYDFGGLDSLPNVYVAGTALALLAMLRHRAELGERAGPALRRGIAYVLDEHKRADGDEDEWIFARIYALELVAALRGGDLAGLGVDEARLGREAGAILAELRERQGKDGAFRHEYANPFVTASTLHSLALARDAGIDVPKELVDPALAALARVRSKDGAYPYTMARGRASVPAAAGRMPLCEGALLAWERSDAGRLGEALGQSFRHHDELEHVRRYDDHAGKLGLGGFFYWYDQYGRRLAIDRLGADGAPWRARLVRQVLDLVELDGSFVDSHELGKSYGTAMALLCLPPAGSR